MLGFADQVDVLKLILMECLSSPKNLECFFGAILIPIQGAHRVADEHIIPYGRNTSLGGIILDLLDAFLKICAVE